MLPTLFAVISVIWIIEPVLCAPIVSKTSNPRAKRDTMAMPDYLMSFGYIDKETMSASNLRSGEELNKALKSLQKIGHIPETGKVDAATKDLMSKPRCGMPDMPDKTNGARERRYAHSGQRWNHNKITWNLGRTPRHLRRDHLLRDVQRAFEVWASHSNLTFHERPNDINADIQISFDARDHGDTFNFDGRGMILAHAFGPDPHNKIAGDTHFDADEEWTLEYRANSEGTHFFMVALHEFGHSLGLKHSEVEQSVMSPWYSGSDNSMLEKDDVLAIEFLYGKNEGVKGHGRHPERGPSYQTPSSGYSPQRGPSYSGRPDYPPQGRPDNRPQPRPTNPPDQRHPHRDPSGDRHPDSRRPDLRHPERVPYMNVPPKEPTTEGPDITNPSYACDIAYDAISIVRGELFIFKDDLFWRVRIPDFEKKRNPPSLRKRLWKEIPEGKVDAVYERPNNDIVFFVGKNFYVYSGNTLKKGPTPLTSLGLPSNLDKIDAATRFKEHTFFFSGHSYWKFDEDSGLVERGYPREIADGWVGLDKDIDAALKWDDQHTYFFKGKHYGRYDDTQMRVEDMKKSAPFWMKCNGSTKNAVSPAVGCLLLALVLHAYWYLQVG